MLTHNESLVAVFCDQEEALFKIDQLRSIRV